MFVANYTIVLSAILGVNSNIKLICKRLEKTYITCQKEDKTARTLFGILSNSSQSFRLVGTELKKVKREGKYGDSRQYSYTYYVYEVYLIDKNLTAIYFDTYKNEELALINKTQIERFMTQPNDRQQTLTITKSFWWQPLCIAVSLAMLVIFIVDIIKLS